MKGIADTSYSAEFWQYDSRLAVRWNIDPESIPFWSPYSVLYGMPLKFSDPNGDCPWLLVAALVLVSEVAVAPTGNEGDNAKIEEARRDHDIDLAITLIAPGAGKVVEKYVVKKVVAKTAPVIVKQAEKQVIKETEKQIVKQTEKKAIEQTEKRLFRKGMKKETSVLTKKSIEEKLGNYLLNPEHPIGKDKAKWFKEALGFTKDNMADLSKQIVFDPKKAVQTAVTEYGTKFNQVISIKGANGKIIDVTFCVY